ncbi:MAG TPA: NAD(P)-dependent oxidoreductase [Pyrinomonadaceae bacterium]|jgi:nucleoside-diphosphate-sugar epimerase|nr:NAD(P)-dependent oxidoreductase [Pyrinomonadaceae bacterium]
MKILVTGGSGYLGTYVRQFFSADDFSRRSNLDILKYYDAQMVRDYDVVIHLAAHFDKSPEGAQQCFQTNAEGTHNILQHMRPGSVFIYASTKDVYGTHASETEDVKEDTSTEYCGQTAFEWSKLIGEQYVQYYARQNEFRACIFRLSTVFARPSEGNDFGFVTHYVESIKNRQPIRLPVGLDPIRDILYVDDFSRACRTFINRELPFGIYNLGGGRLNAVSLRGIIDKVSKMIEIEPMIEEDPRIPVPSLRYVSDLTKINNQLDWRPQIGVDAGLRAIL